MAEATLPSAALAPHGKRIFCIVPINASQKITYIAKVKSGTAKLLGLEGVKTLPIVKTRKTKGWLGTRSYTLLLADLTEVGGSVCASVDLPVAANIKFDDFYAWAYRNGKIAGIRTPWGRTYAWKDYATPLASAAKKNETPGSLPALGYGLQRFAAR